MLGLKYCLGLDLGQQNDYTVLSVLEIVMMENLVFSYVLRYVKKYRLKTDYTAVTYDVGRIFNSDKLAGQSLLVLDYSGVGRPVLDLFRSEGLAPIGVTITGGQSSRWPDKHSANVCKRDIVTTLEVVIQSQRIKIPSDTPRTLLDDIQKEFFNFSYKIKNSGSTTYEAAGFRKHDDIVMSMGVALWYLEHRNKKSMRFQIKGGN